MDPHHRHLTAAFRSASFLDTAPRKGYKYPRPSHPLRQPLPFPPHQQLPPRLLEAALTQGPPSYLALMLAGRNAYTYDLPDLGLPHTIAAAQQTEPFWHQFEHVQQVTLANEAFPPLGYAQHNYVYDPFNMQDFVPVFIGSNTSDGKILKGEDVVRRNQYALAALSLDFGERVADLNRLYRQYGDPLTKPFGRVTVSIDDDVVEDARLQDLIRFSRTISAHFMKEGKEKAEAETEARLGFAVEITRSTTGIRTIKLVNSQTKIWTAPPAWAFSEVLDWIYRVRNLPRTQELPQIGAVGNESWSLADLVDVYSAAVILNIRPGPVITTLRGDIIKRLAYLPTTAEEFQHLHERLPVGDVVVRKMVETFLVHGERKHYNNTSMRPEFDKVVEYVNGCGHLEFKELVISIQDKRNAAKLEGPKEKVAGKKEGAKLKGKGKAEASKGSDGEKEAVADGKKEAVVGSGEATTATPASPKDSVVGPSPKAVSKV